MADEPRALNDAPRSATGEQEWTAPLMHALKGRDSKTLQTIFNSLKGELKRIKALAEAGGGGGGVTDHGALTGLADDDHTQYLNTARHDALDHSTALGTAALTDLGDVTITSPEEYQTLEYDGTQWINKHASLVSYVRNVDTVTLPTGTCVYLFGATGDHATVKRADNSSDTTSSKTVGLMGASTTVNNNGPVVTRGYVDGINLTAYAPGDILWLDKNGAFTKTKPTSPDHLVFIGVVVRANNNGIVYVATQNGYELDELHDVNISSPATDHYLYYDGTVSPPLWKNKAFPTSLPPNGAAGGDLTGTYPNPTLGAVGTAGTYTKVTTDSKGRVTAGTTLDESDIPSLSPTKITGTAVITTDARLSDSRTPTGAASGDLTGTYPGPTLAATGTAGTYTKVTTDSKGRVTSGTNAALDDLSDVVISGPANGQALQYNGTNWVNATPSTGVTDHGLLTGLGDDDHTQYLNDSRHDARDHSAALSTASIDDLGDVSATSPSNGSILKYNGTIWALSTDSDTEYTAGSGLSLAGTTFSLAQQGATSGQVLKWNGTSWAPAADTDTNTTYTAGTGLKLTSTTFSTEVDGARFMRSAAQSIATATFTAITAATEDYDTANYHSTSTNTSRMTTPRAGKYLITACIEYAANATGVRAVAIRLDGATYIAAQSTASLGSVLATTVSTSVVYDLASGAYVEMMAYQTSGGNLNALGNNLTHFSITYLGS
jgi:hypothetical protein